MSCLVYNVCSGPSALYLKYDITWPILWSVNVDKVDFYLLKTLSFCRDKHVVESNFVNTHFYTQPHNSDNSDGVLWYHIGCPSVCLSVVHTSVHPSIISVPDDNLRWCQWIFIKLGVCIDIVEIWFWIVQISSIFYRVVCRRYVQIFISRWLLE